jgi:hypothetical protein
MSVKDIGLESLSLSQVLNSAGRKQQQEKKKYFKLKYPMPMRAKSKLTLLE